MSKDRVRLGTVSIDDRERQNVEMVLSGGYLSPGSMTAKFEREVAAAHDKKFGLALNSGQSAIMVALEAARKLDRAQICAVPAITYISSVIAIIQAGLQPQIVDVIPDCSAELKWDEIPDWCDAVLPCHLFGRANRLYHRHGEFVCEDACESIYAPGVGFGDVMCLSFYPSHTITAGFGGMILTDDEELYFKCWQLVNHGRQDWDDYTTCHTLRERFTFSDVGYSLKFSDLNAAVGLAQHIKRDEIISKRRGNAQFLISALGIFEDLMLPSFDRNTFMMFPIIVRSGRRDGLEKALNDENIETRRMMPITTQPVIQRLFGEKAMKENYPGATFINEHGFYVGCHQDMTEEHLWRIIHTVTKYYNG